MLGLFLASLSLGDITGDNVGIISGQPQSWRYYRIQCWDYFWPASVLEILPDTMLGLFLASLSLGDITGDNVAIISGQPQSWRYYRIQCWDYFWPASVLEILPETMLGLFLASLSLGDITGDNVVIISGQPQSWRYYRRQCCYYFWPASVLEILPETMFGLFLASLSLGDITGYNVGIISGQPQSWRYYRIQCWDYFWPASVLEILPETMLGLFLASLSLGDITGDNVVIISGQPQSWRYYRIQCWDYFWPASVLEILPDTMLGLFLASLSLGDITGDNVGIISGQPQSWRYYRRQCLDYFWPASVLEILPETMLGLFLASLSLGDITGDNVGIISGQPQSWRYYRRQCLDYFWPASVLEILPETSL